jgi:hypothetical protein
MAIMYPRYIENLDKKFDSEKTVFNILRSLYDTWHVFHSITWTDRRDGECDFVIFNENHGFITLEVKGGYVKYEDGIWTSTDSDGLIHNIKDPAKKSRDYMRAIQGTWEKKYSPAIPGNYAWPCAFSTAPGKGISHHGLGVHNVLDSRGHGKRFTVVR